jgi:hypothetical protein
MGRVHGRLRAGEHEALVDSEGFFGELCNDLKVSVARGHPVSVECKADSILMCGVFDGERLQTDQGRNGRKVAWIRQCRSV